MNRFNWRRRQAGVGEMERESLRVGVEPGRVLLFYADDITQIKFYLFYAYTHLPVSLQHVHVGVSCSFANLISYFCKNI